MALEIWLSSLFIYCHISAVLIYVPAFAIAIVLCYDFFWIIFIWQHSSSSSHHVFMQLFGFVTLDFLTSVRGAHFSHFEGSCFLWKVIFLLLLLFFFFFAAFVCWIKSTKFSPSSGILFSSVSLEQRLPAQLIMLPLSFACATCQPIVGFCQAIQICFQLKPLRMWCKGQWEVTASPHPGTNFHSKVRDSANELTLICWPLKKPLRPELSSGFLW